MTARPELILDLERLESELLALVTTHLLDTTNGFGATSSLAEAGLDSMAIMQLLLLIEDRFGLWLPEADLSRENFATVRSLARLVRRHLVAREAAQ